MTFALKFQMVAENCKRY